MFIAQVDEVDTYDKNGQMYDVNSLAEYIDHTINGNAHEPQQDEDDDNARYFHMAKPDTYVYYQQVVELNKAYINLKQKIKYPPYIQQKPAAVFFDIQLPPPELS